MTFPIRRAAMLLLLAPLSAQDAGVVGRIPAGTYSVQAMLAAADRVLGTTTFIDPAELARGFPTPLRLQFPVQLDAACGRLAVSALLGTRGLLLVEEPDGSRHVRAMPIAAPEWLRRCAVDTTVPMLFDHPHLDAVVRVELVSSIPPELLHTKLRAAAASGLPCPMVEPAGAGIRITGIAEAVRRATITLAAMDPEVAQLLTGPEPTFGILSDAMPTDVLLTAGEHRLPDLVDLMAANLGINIVVSPAVADSTARILVPVTQRLDWRRNASVILQLLWQQRVLLLELDVRHGLYEAVLATGPLDPAASRASRRTADLVAGIADQPLFLGVPLPARHLEPAQLLERAHRALLAHDPDDTLLSVFATTDGLWITGLAPAVATLLAELQAADRG